MLLLVAVGINYGVMDILAMFARFAVAFVCAMITADAL
jgi:hypothetical protein